MKYLHKFLHHLNESQDITDLSKEELDEMLITDRKWNGLFRGIDFSDFNIEKELTDTAHSGYKTAKVTITLKK